MEPDLRQYYQGELKILREDGALFAARYPRLAPHLGLGPGQNPDPMVERLLESMAYLTARVRQESEAELPTLAGDIVNTLCPALASPLPSISVLSLAPDYDILDKLAEEWILPAGTNFYSEPEGEAPIIRWRSGWPLKLSAARVTEAACDITALKNFGGEGGECAALRLRVRGLAPGRTLRLFIKGDRFSTFPLHDWVHRATRRVFLVDDAEKPDRRFTALPLPRGFVRPAGLAADELILPGKDQSWVGYRLLQEYFACPERFLFWDIGPWPEAEAFANGSADLVLLLTEPPPEGLEISQKMFDPASVPVVNLFERLAEPVRLDHRRVSYQLHPDLRRAGSTQVHSVVSVTALAAGGHSFSVPHYSERGAHEALSWQLRLSPAPDGRGTVSKLSFSGGDMAEELSLAVRVLCTNRHWAAQSGSLGQLYCEKEIPAQASLALLPSPQRDPTWGAAARWRLVSNFALAQASFCGPDALENLRNILTQYAPPADVFAQKQIAGLSKLATEIMFHPLRPSREHPLGGLARGLDIDLELDEEAFRGGSPFIFGSVLELFFGLSSAINHVTRLKLSFRGRRGIYHQWPPRCGEKPLL